MPPAQIKPNIRQAEEGDIDALYALYDQLGKKDDGFFEACFGKDCIILIASVEKQDVGFGILNFEPKYSLYQKLDIPEIQDLNVIPEAREQGVATALLDAFENIVRDQGKEQIGISVGLTKDYGPAQRLYVKQGYIPDGYGVTYDRVGVAKGQRVEFCDALALMMVKSLH
jgi:ribosomal protein S18 acetylase RimI-like enzyme